MMIISKNFFHRPLAALLFLACAAPLALGQARYSITDEDSQGPGSTRIVVLHDNVAGAEAAVTPSRGGELASFKITRNGHQLELLYNARNYSEPPRAFNGRGPLLWPAVGGQYPVGTIPASSCSMGTYPVGGKTYPMPCHGFAKDMPWQEISRSVDAHGARVTVELKDSDATRKYYPFAFHLDAIFEIANGAISVTYVVNSDGSNTNPMPFSIGNHLGFNIPLVKGSDPAAVKFETQNTIQLLRNSTGILNGESKPRSFDPPEALGSFDAHTALPLSGYKSQPFARLIDPTGLTVRVTQTANSDLPEPLIRTNAYGGPRQGYFCPEPWFGVQNSLNTGVGLIKLAPGQSWKWRLLIEVEAPNHTIPVAGVQRFGG